MKHKQIEIGDYFLIITKDNKEYEGTIIGITETVMTIERWNEVKDRLDETDILMTDILMLEGFNDSQTTL
jgi:hypothetical protein